MGRIQQYGIKFPITVERRKSLFDLNRNRSEEVKSHIIHLVFTPVGQKLRDPEFGTNLIQYIFNPNDNQTWGDIVFDIKGKVQRYVKNCEINDITTEPSESGLGVTVTINYTVTEPDGTNRTYELTQTI